jgi:hypothetical protein
MAYKTQRDIYFNDAIAAAERRDVRGHGRDSTLGGIPPWEKRAQGKSDNEKGTAKGARDGLGGGNFSKGSTDSFAAAMSKVNDRLWVRSCL